MGKLSMELVKAKACFVAVACLVGTALAGEITGRSEGSSKGAAGAAGVELPVKVGQRAPAFALRDREGNLVRLGDFVGPSHSGRKGARGLLIDFFRTDCEPCRRELPEVVKFYRENSARVQVLMVALLEEEDGEQKLARFLEQHKLPFPVLVDMYETVAKKYVASGESVTLPAIFYIDPAGTIRTVMLGLKKDLASSLSGFLAEK
ncbi:MAG: hypothetical protein D6806_05880 [Deltaproteobacteria bacterium]|nr:MAG: hypothetical protein D6806_05880 [Deltaproteobacteria bacterium]